MFGFLWVSLAFNSCKFIRCSNWRDCNVNFGLAWLFSKPLKRIIAKSWTPPHNLNASAAAKYTFCLLVDFTGTQPDAPPPATNTKHEPNKQKQESKRLKENNKHRNTHTHKEKPYGNWFLLQCLGELLQAQGQVDGQLTLGPIDEDLNRGRGSCKRFSVAQRSWTSQVHLLGPWLFFEQPTRKPTGQKVDSLSEEKGDPRGLTLVGNRSKGWPIRFRITGISKVPISFVTQGQILQAVKSQGTPGRSLKIPNGG